ncbi:hypothetical protein ACS0TY_007000 [Phlomoides rotata]
MSITQRSESMNSYFDGYVNASTNLNQFFNLYEKALESRHEKEVKADFDTMNASPVLRTPSLKEKHTSEFYARKIFMRFQEELVSTLTFMAITVEDDGEVITYQVSKFGEDHKAYLTPAERVKAKMKLQLSNTAENDEAIGKGYGWEHFEFNKDAPLDDERKSKVQVEDER